MVVEDDAREFVALVELSKTRFDAEVDNRTFEAGLAGTLGFDSFPGRPLSTW